MRRNNMKVNWEVEDGYIGKYRPQHTEIDDIELLECETEEEVKELIDDAVQEDFSSKIYYSINNTDDIIKYWKENKLNKDNE